MNVTNKKSVYWQFHAVSCSFISRAMKIVIIPYILLKATYEISADIPCQNLGFIPKYPHRFTGL